jgi:aromatic-L-amino-acid/L-tryptophan decarboxylase
MSDARRPLGDLPPEELRAALHRMADWVADYREHIETRAIVPDVRPGDIASRTTARLPDDGESIDRILDDLDTTVLPGVVHWGHPAFLGYFGSTSNGPALLGEIAAAALNVSAMTWKTSPAATELETVVLAWIRELIGLPAEFTGIVYDTASVATLHALAAAREGVGADVRARGLVGRDDMPAMRVYASDQAHSSVAKAMVVLGLGEDNLVRVASDETYRMRVDALREAIEVDVRRDCRPLAVVATVGTTSSASVDPVSEIAAVCGENGAWLHVDAAYGGAYAALPEGRIAMAGTELADSIVINPHKWLFVPLDFSALYVRAPDRLRAVFSLVPEYLRGDSAVRHGAAIDYMDYGIQLGRRFRALKAWMAFRAFGRSGLVSRIREHCRLAAMLADLVRGESGFELAAPQSMGVVCFRFTDLDDAANEAVVERVNASGEAYVTHTRLGGRTCIRVGIGNVLTTEEHVRRAWALILRSARGLSAGRTGQSPSRGTSPSA